VPGRIPDVTLPRMAAIEPGLPTICVSHSAHPERHPDLCATRSSRMGGDGADRDWHRRFRARTVVYGHMHIRGPPRGRRAVCDEVSRATPTADRHRKPSAR